MKTLKIIALIAAFSMPAVTVTGIMDWITKELNRDTLAGFFVAGAITYHCNKAAEYTENYYWQNAILQQHRLHTHKDNDQICEFDQRISDSCQCLNKAWIKHVICIGIWSIATYMIISNAANNTHKN